MSEKIKKDSARKDLPLDKRQIIFSPEHGGGKETAKRVCGYVFRFVILLFAVFGMSLFINDAIKSGVAGLYQFLISLLFVAALSLVFSGFPVCIALGVAAFTGGLVYVLTRANVILSIKVLVNTFIKRLDSFGFYVFTNYKFDIPSDIGSEYIVTASSLLIVLMSLIYVPFIIRRAKILVPAIFSCIVFVWIFTFNISDSNWAFMAVAASFFAIIVICIFDKIYFPRNREKNFDTETVGFEEERPEYPAEYIEKLSGKQGTKNDKKLRKEKARERRIKKREERTLGASADSEISDFFSGSVKVKANNQNKAKKNKLSDGEKRARAQKRREIRKGVAKVRRYERRKSLSKSSAGGFAGFGAFVLAVLILVIPAASVTGYFKTVKVLDNGIQYYRKYITALIRGDDEVLDTIGYELNSDNFKPHSTEALPLEYYGTEIFTASSVYPTNTYLRGWIATDYEDGEWHAVNSEQLEAYRGIFDVNETAAESLMRKFYSLMLPEVLFDGRDYITGFNEKIKYGFIEEQINLDRVGDTGDTLAYLPSFYDEIFGFRGYKSDIPSELTYVNYFDGIYTGRNLLSGASYSAVAFVPTQRYTGWYVNIAKSIAKFNLCMNELREYIARPAYRTDFVRRYIKGTDADGNTVISDIYSEYETASTNADEIGYRTMVFDKDGKIIYNTLEDGDRLEYVIRYAYLMSSAERTAFADYIKSLDSYSDFVYSTYLGRSDSEIVRASLASALSDGDFSKADERNSEEINSYMQRHRLVMAIVDHLKENCEYTLSPDQNTDPSLDPIENFLTVTNEGYCVQFASAAALMLREAGVPARYVEGYVLNDFTKSGSSYSGVVRDWDRHAWIEVWYDGIGWIQYETTPVYYDDMYSETGKGYSEGSNVGDIVDKDKKGKGGDDSEDTPDTPDDPLDDPGSDIGGGVDVTDETSVNVKLIVGLSSIALTVALIVTLLVILLKKAKKAEMTRRSLADTVLDGSFFGSGKDNNERCREIGDMINDLFALCGTKPEAGEFACDFAKRISLEYADVFGRASEYDTEDVVTAEHEKVSDVCIGDMYDIIAKAEFGGSVSDGELAKVAGFYLEVKDILPHRLGKFKRMILHLIKRKI